MKPVAKSQYSLGFFLPHALRWLITGSLLALLGLALYIGIRFYHVDNQLYLWWHDMGSSPAITQSHADSLPLHTYNMEIDGRTVVGVDRNLSGLAFDNDAKQLIAVINRPATLLRMDLEGRVLQRHRLRHASDIEGVAYLGKNHVALVEEKRNRIIIAKLPDSASGELDLGNASSFAFDLGQQKEKRKNVGFEGIGYDQQRDLLYVAKERSPQALYRITGVGEYLESGRLVMRVENLNHWLDDSTGTDLSSAEVNVANGHLLLLSDESQRIVELDHAGTVVNRMDLRGVPQAEGLALGPDGTLYMISEPNLFYRLKSPE